MTVIANAIALAAASALFDGIRVGGSTAGKQLLTVVLVGLLLGVVNAIVAPIAKLMALPLILLTLGLFLLLINAAMLWLTTELASALDLRFVVDGFWTYVGGALVVTLVGTAVNAALRDD